MTATHFDLIIIGGGLVGAGLALALQNSNIKIALIDARLPSTDDPRLFALNYSSCQFLTNLGLWPALAPHATPINTVHVSVQGRFGAVRLHHHEADLNSLGHVIPARHIEENMYAALEKAAKHNPNLVLYRPAALTSLQQTAEQAIITIGDDHLTLTTKVLIGADGTASTVRNLAGITTETVNYQQSAIVTKTTLQRSHQHIAYERFTPQGAIALLPLGDNQCATIWSAENNYLQSLSSLSDDDFVKKLQHEFGYRAGRFIKIDKRHHFPLKMVRAKTNWQQHVLLVGNAAHTLHPIAAQGFNLALYEVAVLAEQINKETVSAAELAAVLAKAKPQEAASMNVSHYLSELFSGQTGMAPFAMAGMMSLDAILPLKKKFIERMTGRTGRVPRLLLRGG